MSYLDLLRTQLRVDEGVRKKLYKDMAGHWSIACGRNLDAVGVRDDEIALMLENDIKDAETAARQLIPNFEALSDVRKAVVVNCAFQLGYAGFSQFTGTLRALRQGKWADAARGMMSSKVAREQAPARWARHAERMRTDIA